MTVAPAEWCVCRQCCPALQEQTVARVGDQRGRVHVIAGAMSKRLPLWVVFLPTSFGQAKEVGPRRVGNFSAEDDFQQERPPGVSERIYPFPTKTVDGAGKVVEGAEFDRSSDVPSQSPRREKRHLNQCIHYDCIIFCIITQGVTAMTLLEDFWCGNLSPLGTAAG